VKDSKSLFQNLENTQVKYVNKEQGSIWSGNGHQSTCLHNAISISYLNQTVGFLCGLFERLWVKPEYPQVHKPVDGPTKPLSCWWVFPII
jgi:hypothetical protein